MASSANVFVVTEQPALLGRIEGARAGEQIQEFLVLWERWKRRHGGEGVAIPTLDKLMEEEDLDMIRVILMGEFLQDDERLHPEEYQARDADDDEPEELNALDEALALAERRAAARAARRGDDGAIPLSTNFESAAQGGRPRAAAPSASKKAKREIASELIQARLTKFEKMMFAEENLLAALRQIYGPQTLWQAEKILKKVKMEKTAPYRSPQPAVEYVAQYRLALQWGQDHMISEKLIIKQFISSVHPPDLARELALHEFKNFGKLTNYFSKLYFSNYQSFLSLGAFGALTFNESAGGTPTKKRNHSRGRPRGEEESRHVGCRG